MEEIQKDDGCSPKQYRQQGLDDPKQVVAFVLCEGRIHLDSLEHGDSGNYCELGPDMGS